VHEYTPDDDDDNVFPILAVIAPNGQCDNPKKHEPQAQARVLAVLRAGKSKGVRGSMRWLNADADNDEDRNGDGDGDERSMEFMAEITADRIVDFLARYVII
jgi:hypothetical protein